jgi:hypothetical protein
MPQDQEIRTFVDSDQLSLPHPATLGSEILKDRIWFNSRNGMVFPMSRICRFATGCCDPARSQIDEKIDAEK